MPNPTQQDPFGGQGPFNKYIDPVQTAQETAPKWDNGQQFNGYEGGLGKTLGIFSKVLQGVTQGRISAFAKKEQAKAQSFGQVAAMNDKLQTLDVDPAGREEVNKLYATMVAKRMGGEIKLAGTAKDKGIGGHIGSFLSSAVDKVAGGPFSGSGEPTQAEIIDYQAKVAELMSTHGSGATARAGQMALLREADKEVRDTVKTRGDYTPTKEDFFGNKKFAGVTDWFRRYDKPGFEQIQDQYSGVSNSGSKGYYQAELGGFDAAHDKPRPGPLLPAQPPTTRAEAGMMPMQHGYLESNRQALQPGGPPQQSAMRLPVDAEQTVPMVGAERRGPPEATPMTKDEEQHRAHLVELAGYGPKEEKMVTVFNPDTKTYESTTVSQARVYNERATQILNNEKTGNLEKERVAKNKEWFQTFTQRGDFEKNSLNLRARAIAVNAGGLALQQLKNNEAEAPKIAMTKLQMWAAGRGIKPSEFVNNLDKLVDAMDDPEITNQRGYIIDQFSRMQERSKSNDWAKMFGDAAGEKPASATQPDTPTKPPAPPKTAAPVHPVTAKMDKLFNDGSAPAAGAQADPGGVR